tara:strand:+ start:611 stop:1591 length:981 start_codon:yes stop_codon:yes gene_type:complete
MIVNLFRHTQAVSIISLLALCIFFWVGLAMHEVSINDSSWNPLFNALINPINNIHPLKEILTAFLVFWQCLYINKMVVAQKIISTNSFYPALFYFILISFWPGTLTLSSELLAASFILIALNKTIRTYLALNTYSKIFKIGFSLSIASLIHPPFFLFIPLTWIGMSIFSQGEMRHWILSLLAIISPWIILISFICYCNIPILQYNMFFTFLLPDSQSIQFNLIDRINLILLGGLFLISMIELLHSLNRKNIKARKSYIFLLWVVVIFSVYNYINPSYIGRKLLILSIPFSIILSNYFYYNKKSNWLNFVGIVLLSCLFITHLYLPS